MELDLAIKKAQDFLGTKYFKNLKIEYREREDDALIVDRNGINATISYGRLVELFRGLTLIKENASKDIYHIELKPNFKHNGLMHDCSRNAVMNVNSVKQMILVHALIGLNRFMLYTEDTYEIEGEPYFGYFRGRYTKQEIKEIDEYASSFGVELVPCIQTLSHLNQAFRWNGVYGEMMSSAQTVKIGEEKTYALIEKMIKTVAENFSSRSVHIGMDEAIDINVFDYLYKNKFCDRKALMLYHLKRVVAICKKYGMHPMMWEDMFFKIDPKATPDWYNFEGKLEEDIKKEIPSEVELIYWDYYHDEVAIYDKMMKASLDTGKHVIFGSGFIRWIGFCPNYNYSLKKASAGLTASLNNHIDSVMATTWGDAGSEGTVISTYPFLALHSCFDYYGKGDKPLYDSLTKAVTDLSVDEWMKLQLPNQISGEELLPFENPSKCFLYNDPLLGLFDTRAFNRYEEIYRKNAQALLEQSKKSKRFGYAFKSLSDLCDLLAVKVDLGKLTREAYSNKDKAALKACLDKWVICKKKLENFICSFREQWYTDNKMIGFEVTDGRLGFLKQRIETAIVAIASYLEGNISSIEELEQQPLPYNNTKDEDAHCFNIWNEMASASAI